MADVISNKRAYFDFEILETLEAGIVLSGHETKSVRLGRAKIDGAHVVVRGGEAYVIGMSIAPYQAANMPKDYDPEVPRKLLLTKKEIAHVLAESDKKGLTVVPLSMHNQKRYIKMKIGVARGKKNYDKRAKIQERETDRSILRTLKNQKNA